MSGQRVAVYTDYTYHRQDGGIYAERAFTLFLSRLAEELDRLVLLGRLDPAEARARYALSPRIEFVELPFYRTLAEPLHASSGMLRSLGRFWRSLDDVDTVWILGPHPLAVPFALTAWIRRRRVVLGVRQDFPSYVRSRRPGRRGIQAVGRLLEAAFRGLSRLASTVVVGPQLARNYRHSRRLLEIAVSLVPASQLVEPEAAARSYDGGELRALSVGRLDAEKNAPMLADVLAELRGHDPRWRLTICGEGDLEDELRARIAELGLDGAAELRGYVPLDGGLADLYRESHALLHVSWTEGLPQILFEAFAAGLPVVATDVGGIREAVGEAVALVPPGDPAAAADALRRIASDAPYRERLIARGLELVRDRTVDSETRRVAAFLAGR